MKEGNKIWVKKYKISNCREAFGGTVHHKDNWCGYERRRIHGGQIFSTFCTTVCWHLHLLYNFLSDILKIWKRNRAILQSCIAHGFLEICG